MLVSSMHFEWSANDLNFSWPLGHHVTLTWGQIYNWPFWSKKKTSFNLFRREKRIETNALKLIHVNLLDQK